MPRTKYVEIYEDLKKKIEQNVYEYQELLPSENTLVKEYDCSRNTLRRAIGNLANEGYVQTKHGKGVHVIYQDFKDNEYMFGETETFKEFATRNNKKHRTDVIVFEELVVDEDIHEHTRFPIGIEVYHLKRVRYLEGNPVIMDYNYFRKDIAEGLTTELAEDSIYEFLDRELDQRAVTAKRKMVVERTTDMDEKYLKLDGFNSVVVVTSHVFNADGVMFEHTESRHTPGNFVFFDQTQRK
ncbi:UTRA domain-containing protein [Priestia megaterium]|uniref:UTRA domain-containing protein n=1 Tax=Priestia megaterium TaxID=1404 RepID=UPI000BF8D419|nr:UTRA domain-containing protein [Priestia megaterium]PEU67302.1 GntR family transcriptional regulator [Priestia megaterium]PFQ80599.1 GntR family transcriptional regulator [Priestia megaterium]PFW51742.1 GntR family transcriptional regulator [Priestia megaterium]TJZ31410.1 UTRA domain-containing protein [Priestia megaterium]